MTNLKPFSVLFLWSNFGIGSDRARSYSIANAERNGVLSQKPFVLSEYEIALINEDGVSRVFIDYFQEIGDGKMYKGQW